jgi:hypothetical protein
MTRKILLWCSAVLLTILIAYYQRITGPTYPVSGTCTIAGKDIHFTLPRSHDVSGNAVVAVRTGDAQIGGRLEWKRFNTDDAWTSIEMQFSHDTVKAELPIQPPAGKLQYRISLISQETAIVIPQNGSVVIRYKGVVPVVVLLLHILVIFGAMVLSTRTGLECFNPRPGIRPLAYWTIAFLFVGGALLGPIVQYYAFGVFWSGWPVGGDLTDNKTAVALIGWIIVAVVYPHLKKPKIWALGAAVLLILVYLIPHSLFGSELDYRTIDIQKKTDSILVR